MLRLIVDHPLNRSRRAAALGRWAGWQVRRRISRRRMTVSFWEGLRLHVYPDWPYSWTAIYFRLTEYDEMMFVLRYLRPGDAFIDVGANIGFYCLLASSANGASPVLAMEPHPLAATRLCENADLNGFSNIHLVQAAAGDSPGLGNLTEDLVDQNHMVARAETTGLTVPVIPLDSVLESEGMNASDVGMVKTDTEGFESRVLAGADNLLKSRPGPVWLIEMTGLGRRYGASDELLRSAMERHGYQPLRYDAVTNRLSGCTETTRRNVIFARDSAAVAARLSAI